MAGDMLEGGRPLGEPSDGKKRLRSFLGFATSDDDTCSNGSSTVKMVPLPSSLVTRICLFTGRTYQATTARSTLIPPLASFKLDSTCSVWRGQSS